MTGRNVIASMIARAETLGVRFRHPRRHDVRQLLAAGLDGRRAPFLPFFPALVLIGLYAGSGPRSWPSASVTAHRAYFWIPPVGWTVGLQSDLAALVFFGVAASVVVAVAVRARSLIAAHDQARAAQEAVRESEERLLLALEGAQIGMWSTDLGTGVTRSSDINLRLFGLPAGSGRHAERARAAN